MDIAEATNHVGSYTFDCQCYARKIQQYHSSRINSDGCAKKMEVIETYGQVAEIDVSNCEQYLQEQLQLLSVHCVLLLCRYKSCPAH